MEIKNAYAVDVDFDGDIRSETAGFHVFAGEGAEEEVRALVVQALKDMNEHSLKRHGYDSYIIDFFGRAIGIPEVLKDDQILDDFIEGGGESFGNWDISIYRTGE